MYRFHEGPRGQVVARAVNRGLAYWSDGNGDDRTLLLSPGFQLIALNAKSGVAIPGFGKNGIIDLTDGLDRDVVNPGQIGASSQACPSETSSACDRRRQDAESPECSNSASRSYSAHRRSGRSTTVAAREILLLAPAASRLCLKLVTRLRLSNRWRLRCAA
jgi:glucose dehydrogenase